jgi:hypothetical protein
MPDFHIIQTNGEVTKIYFEVTSSEGLVMDNLTNLMILSVKSYVCAQRGENFLSQFSVFPRENTAFKNFEYTRSGITVKNSVTYEGYHPAGEFALFPDEAEKQYFHLVFSMEKTA